MNHADVLIPIHAVASTAVSILCLLLVAEMEIIVSLAGAKDSPIAFPKLRFWRNAMLVSLSILFAIMVPRWLYGLEWIFWLTAAAKIGVGFSSIMALYHLRSRRLQLTLLLKQLVAAAGRG